MRPPEKSSRRLNAVELGSRISVLELSARSSHCLEHAKIETIRDLVQKTENELLRLRHFGRKSLSEVVHKLESIGRRLGTPPGEIAFQENEMLSEAVIAGPRTRDEILRDLRSRIKGGRPVYVASNRARFSDTTTSLNLGTLHLHTEVEKLNSAGCFKLRELLELFGNGFPKIRCIGRVAIARMYKAIFCVNESLNTRGDVDWRRFSEITGIRMLPGEAVPLVTGSEFLRSLDPFVQELTTHCLDRIEGAILAGRLVPDHAETLESLGRRFGVTRERIRQKQRNVLGCLSAAALDDNYQGANFRLSPEFSAYWKRAAQHFGELDKVSYGDFVGGLAKQWDVRPFELTPHLPLIYLILTSSVTLPKAFRTTLELPNSIYCICAKVDLAGDVRLLHPTRSLGRALAKRHISTIGKLLSVLMSNGLPDLGESSMEELRDIIRSIASSVLEDGKISWEQFVAERGFELLPKREDFSPEGFAASLTGAVENFIANTRSRKRWRQIFYYRIAPPPTDRKTLAATALAIGACGPEVKREEKLLLERISRAVYESDYTDSRCRFRDSFLERWKRASEIYERAGSPERFVDLLKQEWGLTREQAVEIAPTVSAVKMGAPTGRTSSIRISITEDQGSLPENALSVPSVIHLRGFKRLH